MAIGTMWPAVGSPEAQIESLSSLKTADRALFGGLIDYAGLFPPALLNLDEAIVEYRRARSGPHRWLLGRFIIPATRLEDLGGSLMASMTAGEEPWAISAILDGEIAGAAVLVRDFDAEMEPAAQVALLEAPLPIAAGDGRSRSGAYAAAQPAVIAALTASVVATPLFEVPRTQEWETGIANALGALVDHRSTVHRPLGAKLRCGGVVADAFPSPAEVAEFIFNCTEMQLPYKATAGLHHPVRHVDHELGVMRHGFLNLLMAGAKARRGASRNEIETVVADDDADAFSLTAAGFSWRGETVRVGELSETRAKFASYGSCSFDEPVEDLISLGMIKQ
ncbi:MAG: hypothetical protein HKN91_15430 [Acidimicrobiia bacterium]|nr:hypothetical protein [Acidimicrobiia bacterium]